MSAGRYSRRRHVRRAVPARAVPAKAPTASLHAPPHVSALHWHRSPAAHCSPTPPPPIWQLAHALLHVSCHTTFLLRGAATLHHVHVADKGTRLVLHHLPFGAEFPDPAESPDPEGGPPPCGEGDTSAALAGGGARVDLALLRDRLLLADCVRMLTQLISPTLLAPTAFAPAHAPARAPSAQFRAICAASAHRPPTLQQLVAHPYFGSVSGAAADVELAFSRYADGAERAPPACAA